MGKQKTKAMGRAAAPAKGHGVHPCQGWWRRRAPGAAASRSIPGHPGASPGRGSIPEHPPGARRGRAGGDGDGRAVLSLEGTPGWDFQALQSISGPSGRGGPGLCSFPRARRAPRPQERRGLLSPTSALSPGCEYGRWADSLREPPPCDAARDVAEQSPGAEPGAEPMPSGQPGGSSGTVSASPGRCTAETPSSFPCCPALSCLVAPHPRTPPAALVHVNGPMAERSLTRGVLQQLQPCNTLQLLQLWGEKRQPA